MTAQSTPAIPYDRRYPVTLEGDKHTMVLPLPLPRRIVTVESRLDSVDERLATFGERLDLITLRLEQVLVSLQAVRRVLEDGAR